MQKEKFAKEWDWKQVEDEQIWLEPSPRSIYLLNRWKKLNKETFLDLGCGLGRHSLLFASNGFNVKAMDLSEESVRRVKELFKEKGLNIDVKQGDMHHIPFEDKSIDCLLAYHVLTHTNLEGIKIISSELYRILSKSGEAYFDLCSIDGWIATKSNYPKIDNQTFVVNKEGPEFGIPHLCVNLDDILSIFSQFKIYKVEHSDICYEKDSKQDHKHYWIHLIKE